MAIAPGGAPRTCTVCRARVSRIDGTPRRHGRSVHGRRRAAISAGRSDVVLERPLINAQGKVPRIRRKPGQILVLRRELRATARPPPRGSRPRLRVAYEGVFRCGQDAPRHDFPSRNFLDAASYVREAVPVDSGRRGCDCDTRRLALDVVVEPAGRVAVVLGGHMPREEPRNEGGEARDHSRQRECAHNPLIEHDTLTARPRADARKGSLDIRQRNHGKGGPELGGGGHGSCVNGSTGLHRIAECLNCSGRHKLTDCARRRRCLRAARRTCRP